MLLRGMRNKDIQFFFNRPTRPVNSGRITGISKGTYSNSASLDVASREELEAFLTSFPQDEQGGQLPVVEGRLQVTPLSDERLLPHFAQDAAGEWRFVLGEGDEYECKTSFGLRFADPWLRAVAALANNRGGYILFGVDEVRAEGMDAHRVRGLTNSAEFEGDPARISQLVRQCFEPTPRFQTRVLTLGHLKIGVMFVYQHSSRPVIATKNHGKKIKEGDVFFRYSGESARVKYGDLRMMLDERDAEARKDVLPLVQRILELGPERALLADLKTGKIENGKAPFMIDGGLLEKIKLIKEGEFVEVAGAPALRLVGDVEIAGNRSGGVKRSALTANDLIADFLDQTPKADAAEYIRAAVEGAQPIWLPIFYFARRGELDREALVALIEGSVSGTRRKLSFLTRARGEASAHQIPSAKPKEIVADFLQGKVPSDVNSENVGIIGQALSGLPQRPPISLTLLLGFLGDLYSVAIRSERGGVLSVVRRAICRIDELYFPLD